jgi:hypothetical protein
MPIEATKALRWASDPATHALMMDVADSPEGHPERRLRENRLLRHASKLFGLPKHGIPLGKQRQHSLLWLANLVNKTLEHKARHDTTDPTVPTVPTTEEATPGFNP